MSIVITTTIRNHRTARIYMSIKRPNIQGNLFVLPKEYGSIIFQIRINKTGDVYFIDLFCRILCSTTGIYAQLKEIKLAHKRDKRETWDLSCFSLLQGPYAKINICKNYVKLHGCPKLQNLMDRDLQLYQRNI
jgi:hypothetical protein